MTEDDKPLAGIDLSAWQPPAAPVDLADRVIAQMASPTGIAAPRSRRRLWIAGTAVAAVAIAAVALYGPFSRTDDTAPSHANDRGSAVATRADHLQLGGVGVDLDPGASLRWHRAAGALVVEELRGSSAWRVPAGEKVHIDTPAVGALDASNSSFRVEVKVNASDVKTIGTTAIVAAAVSLVTVIVYEGHVKAVTPRQTVEIVQGATVELPGPTPVASNQDMVGATPPVAPPTPVDIPPVQDPVAKKDPAPNPPTPEPRRPHEDSANPNCQSPTAVDPFDSRPVCEPENRTVATPCQGAKLEKLGDIALGKGQASASLKLYEDAIACKSSADLHFKATIAACTAGTAKKAKFHFDRVDREDLRGHAAGRCLGFKIDVVGDQVDLDQNTVASSTNCSHEMLDKYEKAGKAAFGTSQDGIVQKNFTSYLACKEDQNILVMATISACRMGNQVVAKAHFKRIATEAKREQAEGRCLSFKVDPR